MQKWIFYDKSEIDKEAFSIIITTDITEEFSIKKQYQTKKEIGMLLEDFISTLTNLWGTRVYSTCFLNKVNFGLFIIANDDTECYYLAGAALSYFPKTGKWVIGNKFINL